MVREEGERRPPEDKKRRDRRGIKGAGLEGLSYKREERLPVYEIQPQEAKARVTTVTYKGQRE